jgi:hypothetical protein
MGTAPKIVRIGAPGALEQPVKFHYTPQHGLYIVRFWRGPKAAILALLPQFGRLSWEIDYGATGHGDIWELSATTSQPIDGSVEVPVDIWELYPIVAERELLLTNLGLTIDEITAIGTSIQNGDKVPPSVADEDDNLSDMSETAEGIWHAMKNGQKSVRTFDASLRRTRSVSLAWNTAAAIIGANTVVSTDTLLKSENIAAASPPIAATVALFGALVYANAQNTDAAAHLHYGWLKDFPSINQAAYNRVSMVTNWEFGLWDDRIYGAPT